MAEAVEAAIQENQPLIAEAGVGTGKTFAYLVPAILARKRVVVSTATIGLQTQIVRKDLPFLRQALAERYNIAFDYALVKGKSNYVCGYAVHAAIHDPKHPIKFKKDFVEFTNAALKGESAGDKTDLGENVPDEWSRVTAEDCIGVSCPIFSTCGYLKAKRAVANSQVLIANHAVVGLDLALSNTKSQNPLLGQYNCLVIDEAHKAADYIRNAFAVEARTDILESVAKSLDHRSVQYDAAALHGAVRAAQSIFNALPTPRNGESFAPVSPVHTGSVKYQRAITDLEATVSRFTAAPKATVTAIDNKISYGAGVRDEEWGDYFACRRAVRRVQAILDAVHGTVSDPANAAKAENTVIYTQTDGRGGKSLVVSPVSVGHYLNAGLYSKVPNVIVTSATLSVGGTFDAVKEELGIRTDPRFEVRVASPFDYGQVSVMYIAPNMPAAPKDFRDTTAIASYAQSLAKEIHALVQETKGRAFVLFTSRVELEATYAQLMTYRLNLLKQDERTTVGALIERYKTDAAAGKAPVLLGLKSFWEGVSIEGDDLSLVIITKLPFPSQSDPIYKALCDRAGDQSFGKVTLPAMIKDLQQGTGRLIRTTTDTGIVAILDSRVARSGYSGTVVRSLPFTARSTDLEKVKARYRTIMSKKNPP